MKLISGYALRHGSRVDRALLVKFMQRTYRELYSHQDFAHLATTVEQYLSGDTKLWWVIPSNSDDEGNDGQTPPFQQNSAASDAPVGCLWLGNAIDQVTGDRHAYVLLLYVATDHRRQGIGSALMHHAEAWARERGDRQIGLQVFIRNTTALFLYEKLGYVPTSTWMAKPLE